METSFSLSNNRTLKIVHDRHSESPRVWDNLTQMIFIGAKKGLGDDHNYNGNDFYGWEQISERIKKDLDAAIIKPVYMYSHSGETISTKPFTCRWDSGQIGFVVITKKMIRQEYSTKYVLKKHIALAESVLEGEIETLDTFVTGEIYGFELDDEDENTLDSCYGFFGSDLKTNGILDHLSEEDKIEVINQL
jgi:hypothetical protein